MLKLPDFTAHSLNLTAAVLDVSTNEIDVRHFGPPKISQSVPEQNKNNKPLEVGGRIGRHPDKGASFRRLFTFSWTLGGHDGFF